MYNSRPRYDRYSSPISLPENYAGNAFNIGNQSPSEPIEQPPDQSIPVVGEESAGSEQGPAEIENKERFKLDIGRLFHGGIGVEELLIIGLILLIAQSDNNDDMILLLALLLFIK